jgi:hypothetical protein
MKTLLVMRSHATFMLESPDQGLSDAGAAGFESC